MNIALDKKIMRRVYAIWIARLSARPVLKAVVVAVFLWRSSAYTSFGNVFANAQSANGFGGSYEFFSSAFASTELINQILLTGAVIFGAWFIYDTLKNITTFATRSTI